MIDVMNFYFIFLAVMNVTAFIIYGSDKSRAKKKKWRIKESTLLGMGFFGGALGAIIGMKFFHHKTRHNNFWMVNIIGVVWQTVLLIFLLIRHN